MYVIVDNQLHSIQTQMLSWGNKYTHADLQSASVTGRGPEGEEEASGGRGGGHRDAQGPRGSGGLEDTSTPTRSQ